MKRRFAQALLGVLAVAFVTVAPLAIAIPEWGLLRGMAFVFCTALGMSVVLALVVWAIDEVSS